MSAFTVVLLYPDYLTDDYGAELFVGSVSVENHRDAVRIVQGKAFDTLEPGLADDPSDFKPILVMKGEVEIVAGAVTFY